MRGSRPTAAVLVMLALAAQAARAGAQDEASPPPRPGVDRQVVVALAYTLGEAHALHRLCAGPRDATWYARMQRLLSEEGGDPPQRRQLIDSFNAGFARRQTEFAACGRRSRRAEAEVGDQGRALAQRLAGASTDAAPM